MSNLNTISEGEIVSPENGGRLEKPEGHDGLEKSGDSFGLEQVTERKESVAEKKDYYSEILSKVQSVQQPSADGVVAMDADIISRKKDAEQKVAGLVEMALEKGLFHAVKVARHLEDFYALDEFHDKLLGEEFHKALLERGIIKDL